MDQNAILTLWRAKLIREGSLNEPHSTLFMSADGEANLLISPGYQPSKPSLPIAQLRQIRMLDKQSADNLQIMNSVVISPRFLSSSLNPARSSLTS